MIMVIIPFQHLLFLCKWLLMMFQSMSLIESLLMLNPFNRFYLIIKNYDFFLLTMLLCLQICSPIHISSMITPTLQEDIPFQLPHDVSNISNYLHGATIIHSQDTYSNLMTDDESTKYDSIDQDAHLLNNEQAYDPHHDDTNGIAHSPNNQINSCKGLFILII